MTEAGREFAPIVRQLGEWGQRWFRPKFDRNELDVGVLMWDMRRSIKADAFPAGRISVQFDFSDLPASKRTWWLVSNGEEVDLCPSDPGFEVGLYVVTDLRTMTRVFMGDLPLKTAIGSGQIELDGSRELRQQFERWLGLSGFADIEDARCRTGMAAIATAPNGGARLTTLRLEAPPPDFAGIHHFVLDLSVPRRRAGRSTRPKNCIICRRTWSMIPKRPAPDLIVSAFTRVLRRAVGGHRFSGKIVLQQQCIGAAYPCRSSPVSTTSPATTTIGRSGSGRRSSGCGRRRIAARAS